MGLGFGKGRYQNLSSVPRIRITDATISDYLILKVKFDCANQEVELLYPGNLQPDDLYDSLIEDYKKFRRAQGGYKWTVDELKGVEIY